MDFQRQTEKLLVVPIFSPKPLTKTRLYGIIKIKNIKQDERRIKVEGVSPQGQWWSLTPPN